MWVRSRRQVVCSAKLNFKTLKNLNNFKIIYDSQPAPIPICAINKNTKKIWKTLL